MGVNDTDARCRETEAAEPPGFVDAERYKFACDRADALRQHADELIAERDDARRQVTTLTRASWRSEDDPGLREVSERLYPGEGARLFPDFAPGDMVEVVTQSDTTGDPPIGSRHAVLRVSDKFVIIDHHYPAERGWAMHPHELRKVEPEQPAEPTADVPRKQTTSDFAVGDLVEVIARSERDDPEVGERRKVVSVSERFVCLPDKMYPHELRKVETVAVKGTERVQLRPSADDIAAAQPEGYRRYAALLGKRVWLYSPSGTDYGPYTFAKCEVDCMRFVDGAAFAPTHDITEPGWTVALAD